MNDLAITMEEPAALVPPAAALSKAEPTTAQPDATAGAETPQDERTYTKAEMQERIEAATAKAAAKAERRAYREALALRQPEQQPTAQQPGDQKPAPRDGESNADYIDRLTDWKLEQREAKTQSDRAQEQRQQAAVKARDLIERAQEVPGFDVDAFGEMPLSQAACDVILDSDVGPNLMAFLTSNPEDAKRILALSPARQAAEIGKLEARVVAAPKVSNASPPIKPIGSRGAGLQKAPGQRSVAEEEAAMRARGSKWVR